MLISQRRVNLPLSVVFEVGVKVVLALARKLFVTETGLKDAGFFIELVRLISTFSAVSFRAPSAGSILLVSVSDSKLPSTPALLTDPSSVPSGSWILPRRSPFTFGSDGWRLVSASVVYVDAIRKKLSTFPRNRGSPLPLLERPVSVAFSEQVRRLTQNS